MKQKLFYPGSKQTCKENFKNSIFIGNIYNVKNKIEIDKIIISLNSDHPKATHLVYAYSILKNNNIEYYSTDAGEPSGTAGSPILNVIQNNNLINTLITVIRYFGGIKLGTGGLVKSYMTTAKNILKKTELKQYIETTNLKFTVNYEFINLIKNFIKKNNFKIINETYTDNINFNIEIPVNKKDMVINNLKNITSDNMFF
jgi:uncharacterized YigZ family protein